MHSYVVGDYGIDEDRDTFFFGEWRKLGIGGHAMYTKETMNEYFEEVAENTLREEIKKFKKKVERNHRWMCYIKK